MKNYKFIKLILILILKIFIIIIYLDSRIIKNPFLPEKNVDKKQKYSKLQLNLNHIRYNFHDLYKKRKLYTINYSYLPYKKINKLISYDKNAENIYNSTGMLNITLLNYYYNNTNIINSFNLNHIHLSMGLDNKYIFLSSISIASILNTSNENTFIHFHILCINFIFEDMKKIIQLNRINKNVEFIFYNAKQVEYDFRERAIKEWRGIGEYTRLLVPEIVNNTNKILILDSGDIIAQKDISEIYFYDIEDNYFSWILENVAGNDKVQWSKFVNNNFYPNGGVCLVNVREFRKDDLYKKAFFMSKAYRDLPCPLQDIFLIISNYKFKFMPLKYNCRPFFYTNEEKKNKNSSLIQTWMEKQAYSPFKYSKEEIVEAALDPVITHIIQNKLQFSDNCNDNLLIQWIQYAKLSGLYEMIKKQYPKPFKCENNLI